MCAGLSEGGYPTHSLVSHLASDPPSGSETKFVRGEVGGAAPPPNPLGLCLQTAGGQTKCVCGGKGGLRGLPGCPTPSPIGFCPHLWLEVKQSKYEEGEGRGLPHPLSLYPGLWLAVKPSVQGRDYLKNKMNCTRMI